MAYTNYVSTPDSKGVHAGSGFHPLKRNLENSHASQAAYPPRKAPRPEKSGDPGYINYCSTSQAGNLGPMPGDPCLFNEFLVSLSQYEGIIKPFFLPLWDGRLTEVDVFDRQESVAAALGKQMMGPGINQTVQLFFTGPLKATQSRTLAYPRSISWVDVVLFWRTNPHEFYLTPQPDGQHVCKFDLLGYHVEVSHQDWRTITSGTLDGYPLDRPCEEDEATESSTLESIERRTSILYTRASELATKARILNTRICQRKLWLDQRRGQALSCGTLPPGLNHAHQEDGSGPDYRRTTKFWEQWRAIANTQQPLNQTMPPLKLGQTGDAQERRVSGASSAQYSQPPNPATVARPGPPENAVPKQISTPTEAVGYQNTQQSDTRSKDRGIAEPANAGLTPR
ncbi:hypothetical protein G7046_g5644 [Stylonectria norvegica]|nr:hypothetical protein G7046_g5644 [Stylonectria norvegica]